MISQATSAASIAPAPRVSVVMPTYNVARYVEEAIRSVLRQDKEDLELIVVDDGSTDATPEVVARVAAQDSRVRFFRQANSGRPSIPRNRGIKEARGGIVTFLDGDDIYLESRVAKIVQVFEQHPDIGIVFHDLVRMSQEGNRSPGTWLHGFKFPEGAREFLDDIGNGIYLGKDSFYRYVSSVYCPLLMNGTAIRREVLSRQTGLFREDMRCGEDIDLWFRIIKDARVAYIDEPLAVYRYREDSTTEDREDFFLGTIRAHLANMERARGILTKAEQERYRRRIAERYQHLAYYYLERGQAQQARGSYRNSWMIRRDPRLLLRYLRTFLPRRFVDSVRRTR